MQTSLEPEPGMEDMRKRKCLYQALLDEPAFLPGFLIAKNNLRDPALLDPIDRFRPNCRIPRGCRAALRPP